MKIPPGTEDGSRLRVSGQGERGPGGGRAGDLIVRFRVKEDRFFERDGLNLVCEIPINLAQATLGSRVRVRTVDNKKIVLKIPAGTQSGTSKTAANPRPSVLPTKASSDRDMYFPGTEDLKPDEMRITALGTGMPSARPTQAAACFLVELGNGDKFLLYIGRGALARSDAQQSADD